MSNLEVVTIMVVRIIAGLAEMPHLARHENTIDTIEKIIDYANCNESLDVVENFIDGMKAKNIF